jgi:hypothetical protein
LRPSFPQYSVALLQSESEMLSVPDYDLTSFLATDDRWNVEHFTERSVSALVADPERFECVVVGYNAVHKSPGILRALRERPPRSGLLILHQLREDGFSFLTDDLALGARRLAEPAATVAMATGARRSDEILVSWPEKVPLDGPDGEATLANAKVYLGLKPAPGSEWRTVLEAPDRGRRVAALVRTDTERWPPVAVCTVLLAPRHSQHRALLTNLVLWCAGGTPSAVVLGAPDSDQASVLHRKLRLQGVRAIAQPVSGPGELKFERWPYHGTASVLLPHEWDPTTQPDWPGSDEGASTWLRQGGRLVLLGPGDSLTVRYAESDPQWIATRWASWFHGTSRVDWHGDASPSRRGSLGATRAVLRVLCALHGEAKGSGSLGLRSVHDALEQLKSRGAGIDCEALDLSPPIEYVAEVRRLLRCRIGSANSVDETVSATVAALEIDALLGGQGIDDDVRHRLESWLHQRFDDAALVDQLDIARLLPDRDRFDAAVEVAQEQARLKSPMSPVVATSLRAAIVACGVRPEEVTALSEAEVPSIQRGLRASPLLAANYLLGLLDLSAHWKELEDPPALMAPPKEEVDQAVLMLGRHGGLLHDGVRDRAPDAEIAGAEALALIAYFGQEPVPTHAVRSSEGATPRTLSNVLEHSRELHRQNDELLEANEELERTARLARVAGPLAIAAAEVLLVLAVAVAWWLVATQTKAPFAFEFGLFTLIAGIGSLCVLAGVGALGYRTRVTKLAANALRGRSAIRDRLAAWAAPPDSPE